jgi:hypothetical protein
MRLKRTNPESDLQRAVLAHLRTRGAAGLVYFHVPQGNKLGGARSAKGVAIQGSINKGLGVRKGVSDLILCCEGKFFALELKVPGRTPTEEQLEFIAEVNNAGGFAAWCQGLDRALGILESWGVLRGKSQELAA